MDTGIYKLVYLAFGWNTTAGTYYGVDKMEPTIGYWLAIPDGTTDEVYGLPLNQYTAHYSDQGWYMIGSVFGGADFMSPNDNPDGLVLTPAFGWDPVLGVYVEATTLNEEEGYWVAVFGECDLTVGGGVGKKTGTLAKVDWTGFAKSHSSMPPSPPNMNWETGELVKVPTE